MLYGTWMLGCFGGFKTQQYSYKPLSLASSFLSGIVF
jgi:hypothetical protein